MPDSPVLEGSVDEESTQFSINAPLVLSLGHDELGEDEMFRLAFLLDAMELRGDPVQPGRRLKDAVVFDLIEMEPSVTKLRVTPRRNLSYDQFHQYVSYLLDRVRSSTGRNVRLLRLAWENRDKGVATDERAGRYRVS